MFKSIIKLSCIDLIVIGLTLLFSWLIATMDSSIRTMYSIYYSIYGKDFIVMLYYSIIALMTSLIILKIIKGHPKFIMVLSTANSIMVIASIIVLININVPLPSIVFIRSITCIYLLIALLSFVFYKWKNISKIE